MAIEPVQLIGSSNFEIGDLPSSYWVSANWGNPSGTQAISQGPSDGSIRAMGTTSNNNGGFIEAKFPIQDGVGMFLGGSAYTSGYGVVFEIVEKSGEFLLRLRMPDLGSQFSDSWHQVYTEVRCPYPAGQDVTFRLIASNLGFHVGVGSETLLELRRLGALRTGASAPIFDATRNRLGVFATKPGVVVKRLTINKWRSRGKVYDGSLTTFEDAFNGTDGTNWNTSLAASPTGVAYPHSTVLAGSNASLRYNFTGYLEIVANTVPVDFITSTASAYSDTTANTGLITALCFQYTSGPLQIRSNGNGGPYIIHINSTVTGASTGIAVESPGGKGPNVFTAISNTSIVDGQWVHILIYAEPISETSSSWQQPYASGTYAMAFHVTSSATPPLRSVGRVGSFAVNGGNLAASWGIGSGTTTSYIYHLKTYQLDMHTYDNNSGIVWSRTTPLPYTSTALPGADSGTIRVGHTVLGLDKSYNRLEKG